MPEAIKLLESTEKKVTKDKNPDYVLHLENTEVILVHCKIVNNECQQYSRVFYIFFLKESFNSVFSYIVKYVVLINIINY